MVINIPPSVPAVQESYAVRTEHLTKCYGGIPVISDVSMCVRTGDIYGLVGKNGAGKTTLMRLILGLANPTLGNISMFDSNMDMSRARSFVGSLVENPALYSGLSAIDNLRRFSILTGTTESEMAQILSTVGLTAASTKKVRYFSLGMKQRLGLAIAMLGRPKLMILDEPVNGLDPEGIKEFRDIILQLHNQGITFIISSHLLDELGKVATRYGVMYNGRLTQEFTPDDFLKAHKSNGAAVTVNSSSKAEAVIKAACPGATVKILNMNEILVDAAGPIDELNALLVRNNVRVSKLSRSNALLEESFLELLNGKEATL